MTDRLNGEARHNAIILKLGELLMPGAQEDTAELPEPVIGEARASIDAIVERVMREANLRPR